MGSTTTEPKQIEHPAYLLLRDPASTKTKTKHPGDGIPSYPPSTRTKTKTKHQQLRTPEPVDRRREKHHSKQQPRAGTIAPHREMRRSRSAREAKPKTLAAKPPSNPKNQKKARPIRVDRTRNSQRRQAALGKTASTLCFYREKREEKRCL
ncbi:hypothetical protein ACOSQ2_012875 [Xanthoceras sorbifolium]